MSKNEMIPKTGKSDEEPAQPAPGSRRRSEPPAALRMQRVETMSSDETVPSQEVAPSAQDSKPRTETPAAARMRRLRERQRLGITLYTLRPETDWREAMVRLGMITEAESRDRPKVEARLSELVSLMLRNLLRDRFSR